MPTRRFGVRRPPSAAIRVGDQDDPTLVRMLGGDKADNADHARHWFLDHVRLGSVLTLLLLFVIPTALAYFAARRYVIGDGMARIRERGPLKTTWGPRRARIRNRINRGLKGLAARCETRGGLRYDPTPTAWEWAVDHGGSGEGYVCVLNGDGWQGGLYRGTSYFSTYPDKPAIFVQEAWQLDENGVFVASQDGSRGAWIPCDGAITVEFLNPAPGQPDQS